MSCLWTWCCRVREDDPDTDSKDTEEQQSEKKKKGKKKRSRSKRSIRCKKESKNVNQEEEKEQRLINQQPVEVEKGAHVLGLPVGLASSLESVSAEALEATAPPPRENLTEEKDAAIKHLMKTLLDEVGIRTEQLLNLQVSSNKDVADAIGELLETLFDDALLASLQPLENKIMDTNQVETEEDTQEKHLDHPVSSNKDVADAIGELLETLFDDALSASLQPLGE
ncbi:hypothetical protein MHYP_G00101850 [Metynnis hypsauchen]